VRTRSRDKWILVGGVVATFSIMVSLDSIVLADVLFVIGGVALMVVPFDRKRGRSPWAKSLLAASGLLLVLKGGVHLLVYYHLWTPSPIMQRGLLHTMATIGGIILGFLLAVAFSGELAGRKRSQHDQAV
jgi:hypothetical protein